MTNHSPRHARAFKPRYYEMDDSGEMTPTAMMGLFEDSAASHCEDTGWDVFRLRAAGFGWILVEGAFAVDRYPRSRESFTIETWLESSRLFYGKRCFEVKDGSGTTIGKAHSLWVFYDLERRRPSPVLDDILEAWKPEPGAVPERASLGGEPPPLPTDAADSFEARAMDIDTNGHVNNVRYLEWALAALPREFRAGYRLRSLRGRFANEVRQGQKVMPAYAFADGFAERDIGSGPLDLSLAVYSSSDAAPKLSACAATEWSRR